SRVLRSLQIVVQCKLYSQPVGNKAVQEIYTAKQHQQADEAIVVSNAGYTIPARQLAATTGVHLLHHQELASFCERLAA
ncbi:restriction endonuclease, partial [Gluconobacter potus]|uniref:restriction endonuclease n=1 Tax=Gluconobacter potus TaxID=2724927 RepID=UPI000ACEB2D9